MHPYRPLMPREMVPASDPWHAPMGASLMPRERGARPLSCQGRGRACLYPWMHPCTQLGGDEPSCAVLDYVVRDAEWQAVLKWQVTWQVMLTEWEGTRQVMLNVQEESLKAPAVGAGPDGQHEAARGCNGDEMHEAT